MPTIKVTRITRIKLSTNMTSLTLLVNCLVLASIVGVTLGQTQGQQLTTDATTSDPGTTTPDPTTVTTTVTTTTVGPTTTTESPTTTNGPTTTDAATTQAPVVKTYCNMQLEHGLSVNDVAFRNDDDECTDALTVDYDVPIMDQKFRTFYVCTNGLVCFNSKSEQYEPPTNGQTGLSGAYCVAPYFADLISNTTGSVWYQLYDTVTDASLTSNVAVQKAESLVAARYSITFDAVMTLVVTWDQLPKYNADASNTVTFQLILTSDGVRTYAFYHYEQGGMNLVDGTQFIGYIKAGTAIGYTDTDDGSFLRGPDENLQYTGGCYGATSYALQENADPDATNAQVECLQWHGAEMANKDAYTAALAAMRPCPCAVTLLHADPYFADVDTSTVTTETFTSFLKTNNAHGQYSQSCVYRSDVESFISSGPNVGTFLKYNPYLYPKQHEADDVAYRQICCDQADICDVYYDVRPTAGTCYNTSATQIASAYGDPHIATLDGGGYTFNGLGEFVMLRVADASIELQVRMLKAISSTSGQETNATVFTAIASRTKTGWFQVEMNTGRTGVSVLAGTSTSDYTDLTAQALRDGTDIDASVQDFTIKQYGTKMAIRVNSGLLLNVTHSQGLLQLRIGLTKDHKTKAVGLLGNYNDDAADEFIPRNSVTSLVNPDEQTILEQFGKTWLTTEAENVFKYHGSQTHASFRFPDFVPLYFDQIDAALLTEATSKCAANDQACIYDYVITRNEALATETTNVKVQLEADKTILANQVPVISVTSGATSSSGSIYVHVNLNAATSVTLTAVDDGTVTYFLSNSTTSGVATLTSSAFNTATLDITVANTNPVVVSVVAKDDKNTFSNVIDFTVVVCPGCSSHGSCDFTTYRQVLNQPSNFRVAVCNCDAPWSGVTCADDKDGCATASCGGGQVCTDTPAASQVGDSSLPDYTCSACGAGFTILDAKCIDVNECLTAGICTDGTCTNTEGNYECVCNAGFRVSAYKHSCTDINECDESTSNCDQNCENTNGGFNCVCHTGYVRSGSACVADALNTPAPCQNNPCPNAHGCTDDGTGAALCVCRSGYTLNTNTNTCDDVDECSLGVCSQGCTNTIGGFTCSCYTGYALDGDQVTCNACPFPSFGANCASSCNCGPGADRCDSAVGCVCMSGWSGVNCDVDVHECNVNPDVCGDVNMICANTIGSYTCTCRSGYRKENNQCVDLDECSSSVLNTCEQTCGNTVGGFTCSCRAGYIVDSADDTKCKDYDECSAGVSGCQQQCTNVVGGFNCECYAGFYLAADRKSCDSAEAVCAGSGLTCSHFCTLEGSTPVCKCNSGYYLGADNQTCVDINECNNSTLNMCTLPDTCLNSDGSYVCSCEPGYTLDTDQRTCTPCDNFHYGVNCVQECSCGVGALGCDPVTGCQCSDGWGGVSCDVDVNECSTSPCTGVNIQCINTQGSYICRCGAGYEQDSVSGDCINVNECDDAALNDCSQTCTDTVGSYTCSCGTGFTQNGTQCTDIDECSGQHDCSQVCTNTLGSYRCSCNADFVLNADKRTCDPAVPCTVKVCGANAACANVSGVETCTCNPGYESTNPDLGCTNINECATSPCSQLCTDLPGTYTCSCNAGFYLDADMTTCTECAEGFYGANCQSTCACETTYQNTATCNKVDGTCTCNAGWEGTTCQTNINECVTQTNPCPENSACANDQYGTYSCICSVGFFQVADGTCQECSSTTYGIDCSQTCSCIAANTATCDKATGTCTCLPGWEGTICDTNINECTSTPGICNDTLKTCADNDGSYDCNCVTGYEINSSLQCIDIDECLAGTDTCTFVCVNTPGSFTCECGPGFTGTGNTCTPCASGTWGVLCANTCGCNATNTVECNAVTGCTCKTGWTGATCADDVNECTAGTHNCPAHSTCTNTAGGFTCPCNTGYTLNSNFCVVCSGSTYGDDCASACDCVVANSLDSTQTCNHVTGTCQCKNTWSGTRCDVDVNECLGNATLCTDKPNQGCHNFDGGYNCSCLMGFELDTNTQTCVISTATTTAAPVPADMEGITMYVDLNLTVDAVSESDNLTVSQTNAAYMDEADTGLTAYYYEEMGSLYFKDLTVQAVAEGSLKVNYTVFIKNTEDARQSFSGATNDLLQGKVVNIYNQPTSVQNMQIGTNTVVPGQTSETTVKCAAYFEAGGQCENGQECALVNSKAACRAVKTNDNFGLVVGLGVGIPLFLIAALIIAIIIILCLRRRNKRFSSSDSDDSRSSYSQGFFPTVMPTRYAIKSPTRQDPVYIPYNWEDGRSTVGSRMSEQSSSSDDHHKKRRRRKRGEMYPIYEDNYGYDNGPSNFSWDFMYNYMGPNDRYEIQRPNVEKRSNKLY